jgi:hypothetical protein
VLNFVGWFSASHFTHSLTSVFLRSGFSVYKKYKNMFDDFLCEKNLLLIDYNQERKMLLSGLFGSKYVCGTAD